MPVQTPCLHCGTVGLVRWERIIKGKKVSVVFTCESCHHEWTIDDRREARPDRRSGGERRAS